MKRLLLTLLTFGTLLLARNGVPSCYKALQIENPNPAVEKELFILVDQTTPLDKNMMKFIRNGYAVTIASFSANANGKYTDVPYSGELEALLPDSAKHEIAKKKLRKYQACMNGQYKYAKKKATKALVRTLKGANKKLPRSDILKSLDDIAEHLIKPSKAKERVVLLVSDMMEHASITTFYSKGSLRRIDIKKRWPNCKRAAIRQISTAHVSISSEWAWSARTATGTPKRSKPSPLSGKPTSKQAMPDSRPSAPLCCLSMSNST